MKRWLCFPALAVASLMPTVASEPGQPPTNEDASRPERPAPSGCTSKGELVDGLCSEGQPVYLPDGKAIGYLRTTKRVKSTWPEGADKSITARLNLQIVVLPDGTVTEVQPTFLRGTLPGEDEERMNPTEDEHGFVKAASDAVAKWRYEPPRSSGQPVAVYGSVCVDFSAGND